MSPMYTSHVFYIFHIRGCKYFLENKRYFCNCEYNNDKVNFQYHNSVSCKYHNQGNIAVCNCGNNSHINNSINYLTISTPINSAFFSICHNIENFHCIYDEHKYTYNSKNINNTFNENAIINIEQVRRTIIEECHNKYMDFIAHCLQSCAYFVNNINIKLEELQFRINKNKYQKKCNNRYDDEKYLFSNSIYKVLSTKNSNPLVRDNVNKCNIILDEYNKYYNLVAVERSNLYELFIVYNNMYMEYYEKLRHQFNEDLLFGKQKIETLIDIQLSYDDCKIIKLHNLSTIYTVNYEQILMSRHINKKHHLIKLDKVYQQIDNCLVFKTNLLSYIKESKKKIALIRDEILQLICTQK